jgi:hypothetical protein
VHEKLVILFYGIMIGLISGVPIYIIAVQLFFEKEEDSLDPAANDPLYNQTVRVLALRTNRHARWHINRKG